MPKPAPFTSVEDVDKALFTFETYFVCSGQPQPFWPRLELTCLSGWLTLAVPHKNAGSILMWDVFANACVKFLVHLTKCLVLACNPPSSYDCLLTLYDGLKANVKQDLRCDPRMGSSWTDFEALRFQNKFFSCCRCFPQAKANNKPLPHKELQSKLGPSGSVVSIDQCMKLRGHS
eukprot:scaffold86393_cov15-Tisochrysis_lutea.AAC.1